MDMIKDVLVDMSRATPHDIRYHQKKIDEKLDLYFQEIRDGHIMEHYWQHILMTMHEDFGGIGGANELYERTKDWKNRNVDLLMRTPDGHRDILSNTFTACFNFSKSRTSYTVDETLLQSTNLESFEDIPTSALKGNPSNTFAIMNRFAGSAGVYVCYMSRYPDEDSYKIILVGVDDDFELYPDSQGNIAIKGGAWTCSIFLDEPTIGDSIKSAEIEGRERDSVAAYINALLMICAKNISVVADPPVPSTELVNTKFLSYARREQVVTVGTVEGSELRANAQYMRATASDGDDKIKRAAHMRRAHWHHYWTGPRDQPENRKIILHWVAPTFVSGTENEAITNHAVTAD